MQMGQILDKIQKDQKPNGHPWRAWSKSRYQHTTPPQGWAKHLSHSSCLTPGHTPTLTPYKEPAPQTPQQARREPVCSCSPCCSRNPNKASSEFLVWPPVHFYRLRRPRTLVGNNYRAWLKTRANLWGVFTCVNPGWMQDLWRLESGSVGPV